MDIKEGTIVNGYMLVGTIGEGAWGTVWKAFNVDDGRPAAAKVLKCNASTPRGRRMRQRFLTEADVMTRIRSPFVCRSFSTYESDDGTTLCYFMEYLEGKTIRDTFEIGANIPVAVQKRWIAQLAMALRDIHACSFIHRDIKPSNVMVLPNGAIKVFDFGIVKDISKDPNKTQGLVFTPAFASPEQRDRTAPVSELSDWYSLGKLVYFMATGGAEVPEGNLEDLDSAVGDPGLREIISLLTEEDLEKRRANVDVFLKDILPTLLTVEQPTLVDETDDGDNPLFEPPTLVDESVESDEEPLSPGVGAVTVVSGSPQTDTEVKRPGQRPLLYNSVVIFSLVSLVIVIGIVFGVIYFGHKDRKYAPVTVNTGSPVGSVAVDTGISTDGGGNVMTILPADVPVVETDDSPVSVTEVVGPGCVKPTFRKVSPPDFFWGHNANDVLSPEQSRRLVSFCDTVLKHPEHYAAERTFLQEYYLSELGAEQVERLQEQNNR